jgi:hypothetical protein
VLLVGPMLQQRGVNRLNQNNYESLCGAGAAPFFEQSMNQERMLQQFLRRACLVVDRTLIMQPQTSSVIGPRVEAFGMCDMV